MGALTPELLLDLESSMRVEAENEYARLLQNLWWTAVAKKRTSVTKSENLVWLLNTATIEDEGKGGNIAFEDLLFQQTEIDHRWAGKGFKIRRDLLEDMRNGQIGGQGVDLGEEWARQIAAQMAYWPQKRVAHFLKNAHNLATSDGYTAYDGKAFFATDHPVNPFNTAAGTFRNIFTGAASGSYPGAIDISEAVTLEVAFANLAKLFGYIASLKMPNGDDPRYLRPKALIVSPRLYPRAMQLLNATTIASAATGGAATIDAAPMLKALGLQPMPIMADELAGFESDTTFFVVAEQAASSQMGPIIYVEREAFQIRFYGHLTEAELDRADTLEWHCKGRNGIAAGHPFLLFKAKAA